MTGPTGLEQLHRIASAWFADHGYLNEAVDHALAYDPIRAVDLVEQDETNLLEQSKMTTLLEIVKKLPPQMWLRGHGFNSTIAWANILLQRRAPMPSRAESFEAGPGQRRTHGCDTRGSPSRSQRAARGGGNIRRPCENVDSLVAEAISRPDSLHPRVPGVAGNIAAFAAIYRFEFDNAQRCLHWAVALP